MDLTLPIGTKNYNFRIAANISYRGKYLFYENPRISGLYSVGGRLKYGETFEEALSREVFEELGCDIVSYNLRGIGESFFRIGTMDYHEHCLIFDVVIDETQELNTEEGIKMLTDDQRRHAKIVPSCWNEAVSASSFGMYSAIEREREAGHDISYRFDDTNEFNVRVSARIIKDGQILVDTSYGQYGHVVPVGGRMHLDETFEESLSREIQEELSTPILSSTFLGVTEDHFVLDTHLGTSKRVHFISFNYDVSVDTDSIVFNDGCIGRWMPLETFNALPIKLESFKTYTKK